MLGVPMPLQKHDGGQAEAEEEAVVVVVAAAAEVAVVVGLKARLQTLG